MDEILLEIANRVVMVDTFEGQGSDTLDFREIAVWELKQMLEEAFKAGQKTG